MSKFEHSDFADDHCSRWSGIDQDQITPLGRKVVEMLVRARRTGVYNLPIAWKRVEWVSDHHVALSWRGTMSTYDFDTLTRLTILAHDEAIRVEVGGANFNHLRLIFHRRERDHFILAHRHSSIEQAINDVRGPKDGKEMCHGAH